MQLYSTLLCKNNLFKNYIHIKYITTMLCSSLLHIVIVYIGSNLSTIEKRVKIILYVDYQKLIVYIGDFTYI